MRHAKTLQIPTFGKILTITHQEMRGKRSSPILGNIAIAFTDFCTKHLTEKGYQLIPRFALTDEEIKRAYNDATNKNTARVMRISLGQLPSVVLHGMHSIQNDTTIINPFGQLPWTDPRHMEERAQRVIINSQAPGEYAAFEEALRVYFTAPLITALTTAVHAEELARRMATVISDLFYLAFVRAMAGNDADATNLLPLIAICTKGAVPIGDRQDGDKLFCCDVLFE